MILTCHGPLRRYFPKIFQIPLSKYGPPTAVLGGVIIIGTLIVLMNYSHPIRAGSQLLLISRGRALVKGRVTRRSSPANRSQKGMCLFRIDAEPFQGRSPA